MTFPIRVLDRTIDERESTEPFIPWILDFDRPNILPPPVERRAVDLLQSLITTALFMRYRTIELVDINKNEVQELLDLMAFDGVKNIHEAVIWAYAQILPQEG